MIFTYEDEHDIRHLVMGLGAWATMRCTGTGVPSTHVREGWTITCLRCAGARQR